MARRLHGRERRPRRQVPEMQLPAHQRHIHQALYRRAQSQAAPVRPLRTRIQHVRKGGEMKKPLVVGDYVLATKYTDGDPCDHFHVGFFRGMLVDVNGKTTDRFLIDDGNGNLARANGFRRCERISARVGAALCAAMPIIGDRRGRSVWWWRGHVNELDKIVRSCNPTPLTPIPPA